MLEPIYFYTSFGSPYSYIAAQQIEDVVRRHKRAICWRPVRLRSVLAGVYGRSGVDIAAKKMDYMRADSERSALLYKLPFIRPEGEPPFDCDEAYACAYALADGNEEKLRSITLALVSAVWAAGQAIRNVNDLAEALRGFHQSEALVQRSSQSAAGISAHDHALNDAISSGMFGAPWFVIENEVFWGHDRLELINMWLSKSGDPKG